MLDKAEAVDNTALVRLEQQTTLLSSLARGCLVLRHLRPKWDATANDTTRLDAVGNLG